MPLLCGSETGKVHKRATKLGIKLKGQVGKQEAMFLSPRKNNQGARGYFVLTSQDCTFPEINLFHGEAITLTLALVRLSPPLHARFSLISSISP